MIKPSFILRFSLAEIPKISDAVAASCALVSLVPLVPNSPSVRSMMATFFPSEINFAIVPPQPNSTSSGCAPIAKTSTFIGQKYRN